MRIASWSPSITKYHACFIPGSMFQPGKQALQGWRDARGRSTLQFGVGGGEIGLQSKAPIILGNAGLRWCAKIQSAVRMSSVAWTDLDC